MTTAPQEQYDWRYTQMAHERFGLAFEGRRIISRDARIDGGVYTGTYGGEALVVDTEKYPEAYDRLEDLIEQKVENYTEHGVGRNSALLRATYDAVLEAMPYSQKAVDEVNDKFGIGSANRKVGLDQYIDAGAGVCRHQALAVGAMLERYIERGELRGQVSIDRSERWSPNDDPSGHAWIRYTNSAGEVHIIDVAQKRIGSLKELTSQCREGEWNYMRPEDPHYEEVRGRSLGDSVVKRLVGHAKAKKDELATRWYKRQDAMNREHKRRVS